MYLSTNARTDLPVLPLQIQERSEPDHFPSCQRPWFLSQSYSEAVWATTATAASCRCAARSLSGRSHRFFVHVFLSGCSLQKKTSDEISGWRPWLAPQLVGDRSRAGPLGCFRAESLGSVRTRNTSASPQDGRWLALQGIKFTKTMYTFFTSQFQKKKTAKIETSGVQQFVTDAILNTKRDTFILY